MIRPIRFVSISLLRATEKTVESHVFKIKDIIERLEIWTNPIRIERNTSAVMDGHHRLEAARLLGLSHVPCAEYDYLEVQVISTRPEYDVHGKAIIERALRGNPYPCKTTKHTFPDDLRVAIPLCELRSAQRRPYTTSISD